MACFQSGPYVFNTRVRVRSCVHAQFWLSVSIPLSFIIIHVIYVQFLFNQLQPDNNRESNNTVDTSLLSSNALIVMINREGEQSRGNKNLFPSSESKKQ